MVWETLPAQGPSSSTWGGRLLRQGEPARRLETVEFGEEAETQQEQRLMGTGGFKASLEGAAAPPRGVGEAELTPLHWRGGLSPHAPESQSCGAPVKPAPSGTLGTRAAPWAHPRSFCSQFTEHLLCATRTVGWALDTRRAPERPALSSGGYSLVRDMDSNGQFQDTVASAVIAG